MCKFSLLIYRRGYIQLSWDLESLEDTKEIIEETTRVSRGWRYNQYKWGSYGDKRKGEDNIRDATEKKKGKGKTA